MNGQAAGCHHHHHRDDAASSEVSVVARASGQYGCPMHPEVLADGPGACPICGMALEPLAAGADAGEDPELGRMERRFWGSLAFTLPVFAIAMAEMLPGQPLTRLVAADMGPWIQFVLATPVVLWGAAPFFARGWASLVNRHLNMFTLIAAGVGVAYLYSVVAVLAPGAFPPAFRAADGAVPVYFEAAAVIVTLVLLGQVMELRSRAQTGSAIRALLDLAPKIARRLNDQGGSVMWWCLAALSLLR